MMGTLFRRLGYWLRRSRHEADLREELETHRALRQTALERQGTSADEATRASRRALGNVTLAREDARRVWTGLWLESVWQDVRIAGRSFVRRPLAWSAAVISLALGIGVNTAVFSAFDAMFLRRLPVPAPDEIVNVTSPGPRPGSRSTTGAGGIEAIFSYPLYRDLERFETTGLSGIAAHGNFGAHLSYKGRATLGDGRFVSGSYFPVLGVAPAIGRLFTRDDDRVPGGHQVAILGHQYWTKTFGANPAVVNDTLVINGQPYTVVGVAPAGFVGTTLDGNPPDVFIPLAMMQTIRNVKIDNRRDHWLYVFGRLAPGVTRDQATALVNVPFATLIRDIEYPAARSGLGDQARNEFQQRRIVLVDGAHGQNAERGDMWTAFALLLSITGCVLLIACANVANLLLARAADRAAETSVRLSIGASPARLLRLFLTESCVLGLVSGLAALGVARLTVAGILALTPADNHPFEFALNPPVLFFALGMGLGTGLLFGLFPSLQGVRVALAAGIQGHSGRTTGSRTAGRVRNALATLEVALATALLAVAGLFIASLVNVMRTDLGVKPRGLAVFSVSPTLAGYGADQSRALLDRIEETLAGLPGVTSVSATTVPILANWNWGQNLTVEGFTPASGGNTNANRAAIGEHYFSTLGMPLLSGREITRADAGPRATVAVVNEAFVRKFHLGPAVIGKRFGFGQGDNVKMDIEIVGVVADAKSTNVRESPSPMFFLSYRQADTSAGSVYFYVRTAADSSTILAPIRTAVDAIDGNLPANDLRTMDEQIWGETQRDRMMAALSAAFAILATVLAAVGLYAVVAYVVSRRWREYGIRLALGATAGRIRRSIFTEVGRVALVGAVCGIAGAFALGRLGRSFMFGMEGSQSLVVFLAAVIAMGVAFSAAVLPARRAAGTSPVEALKTE